jgi:hypothetical protein
VKAQEEAQAAVPVVQTTEEVNPEQIAQEAVAPPEEEQGQQAAPQQPTNLMQRIPHRYDQVLGQQKKPASDQLYDVGRLWSVLSSDPRVDPTVQAIAKRLMRER